MKNWVDMDPVYLYTHNFNRNPIYDVSRDTVKVLLRAERRETALNLQWLAGRNDMNK